MTHLVHKIATLFVDDPEYGRSNNINFIRFLAASSVIFGHMFTLMGQTPPAIYGVSISTLAVRIFFILSGYLIYNSFEHDPNVGRYLIRRCFRIFPALIAVVALWALVLGPFITSLPALAYLASPDTWSYIWHNALLHPQYGLPGIFENNPYPGAVNGSLWTLPVEFAMYLVLMLVLLCARNCRYKPLLMLVLALATSAIEVARVAGLIEIDAVVYGTPIASALELIPFFFWGSLFASSKQLIARLSIQTAFIAAAISAPLFPLFTAWLAEIASLAFLPYITLALSLATPATFGRWFARNDYSYGIYVWAFPIQQLLVLLIGSAWTSWHPFALACIAFAITLPLAMGSWFLIERPANRLGRKITSALLQREQEKQAALQR